MRKAFIHRGVPDGSSQDVTHTILGPGGVGGLIGAVLARLGNPVAVIVRSEVEALQPRQLTLESGFGSFSTPVAVASKLGYPTDVLWIAVKSTQLDDAVKSIPSGTRIGAIVPSRDRLHADWDTASVERADTAQLFEKYRELARTPGN